MVSEGQGRPVQANKTSWSGSCASSVVRFSFSWPQTDGSLITWEASCLEAFCDGKANTRTYTKDVENMLNNFELFHKLFKISLVAEDTGKFFGRFWSKNHPGNIWFNLCSTFRGWVGAGWEINPENSYSAVLQPEPWLRIRKLEVQGPSNSYF